MAQPQNPNAQQQQQEQNAIYLLLDPLYCEEDHYLGQASKEEEDSYDSNNLNNVYKSNPHPILCLEQNLFWEEDELQFLLSKEEEEEGKNHLYEIIDKSPSLDRARSWGVEWMLKVSAHYAFSAVTFVLAVNYLDRFLFSFCQASNNNNQREEKPWMTQLAAVACLSLAAKVEETHVPLLLDLRVGDPRYVFEAKTIQRMEILVLSTLKWKMNPVTPLSFVDYIVRRLGLKDHLIFCEFLRRCEHLLRFLVCDSRVLCFRPSVMAMATVLQVMDRLVLVEPCIGVEYQNQLFGFLKIDKEKVEECRVLIRELIKGTQSQLRSHKRKFRWPISPPPGSPSGVVDASFSCDSSNDSWSIAAASPSPLSVSSSPEPLFKKSRGMPLPQEDNSNFLTIPPRDSSNDSWSIAAASPSPSPLSSSVSSSPEPLF